MGKGQKKQPRETRADQAGKVGEDKAAKAAKKADAKALEARSGDGSDMKPAARASRSKGGKKPAGTRDGGPVAPHGDPRDPPLDSRTPLPGREADLARAPLWEPVYPGSGRLAGKVAIVTGGDSGIGRAVAALYAREGADVAIVYLSEEEDAHETARFVEAEGRRALLIAGDLGDPAVAREVVARTVRELGRLDIVVNNAGEQHPQEDIRDISDAQLRRTFQTNIFSMFYLTQAALDHLDKGAAIINCSSITMYQGSKNLLDYSATKGAITAFTRSLSEALVDKGIRVNGVAPGPIWTPLNPMGGADPEKIESFGETTPMKRAGEPNEVAPSFLFLACADSSYMSGQTLHPNGGTVVNG